MSAQRHLSRAPLREALIDIQFEPRLSLVPIDKFIDGLDGSYRTKGNIWETSFGLHPQIGDSAPTAESRQSVLGRRVELLDGPYVLQCRSSGFTLSRLSPYGEWSELRSQGRLLWDRFVATVGELVVTRVAVRYINEIALPLPIADFGDYLTCPPKVPDSLPQGISGFLTRVIIPDEATQSVAVVTQAFEGPPSEGATGASITVVLDIDVFRQVRLDSSQASALWDGLEVLRDQKNRMFFGHLEEKAVEMYA